jgi:hypothetical protein
MKPGVERLLFLPRLFLGIASFNPFAAVLASTFASTQYAHAQMTSVDTGIKRLILHTHLRPNVLRDDTAWAEEQAAWRLLHSSLLQLW